MGLDMYLVAKRFVWNDDDELAAAIKLAVPCPVSDKPKRIEYDVMYWRKANQIHKWFVDNVQEGNDDCGTYYVPKEKLTELRDLCKKVLDTAKTAPGTLKVGEVSINGGGFEQILEEGQVIANSEEVAALLPTEGGFFFGSTDYDSYYLDDIKETKEVLDKVLSADTEGWDFEYHSSW